MTRKYESGFSEVLLLGAIVVVIISVLGYSFYQNMSKTNSAPSAQLSTTKKPTSVKHISKLEFSNSVNSKGAPAGTMASFTSSTPQIYAATSLIGAKKGDRVSYTRYLDGKFVDNGGLTLTKDAAATNNFAFALNSGKARPVGKYTVKVYFNGAYQLSNTYTVS